MQVILVEFPLKVFEDSSELWKASNLRNNTTIVYNIVLTVRRCGNTHFQDGSECD